MASNIKSVCSIAIGHINTQHSVLGIANLVRRVTMLFRNTIRGNNHPAADVNIRNNGNESNTLKIEGFIYHILEPYLGREKKPLGIPKTTNLYYAGESPRAVIWSSFYLYPLMNMSDRDVIAAILVLPTGPMCFAAVYMDILNNEVISPNVHKLVTYCQEQGIKLVINSDTNAHSPLWGCEETNARGEKLEDFILQHGLEVSNIGSTPTFERVNASTIIDVTLTAGMAEEILEWQVHRREIPSDHNLIEYKIVIDKPEGRKAWNLSRADWDAFRKEVAKWSPPQWWTPDILDQEADRLARDIKEAMDKACPTKVVSSKIRTNWWTVEVSTAKAKWRKAVSLAKRWKTEDLWESTKEAQRVYNRALKKAKRKTWQEFCCGIENQKGMSILNKAIQGKGNKTLGQLKFADGTQTKSMEASMESLFREHFLGCLVLSLGQIHGSNAITRVSQQEICGEHDIVMATKVQYVIESMAPNKAAGPDEIKNKIMQQLDGDSLNRLIYIYRAMLLLGYTPRSWRESCVVPKYGKEDYTNVRSFLPISLMNTCFKVFERIILWYLLDNNLAECPMSND